MPALPLPSPRSVLAWTLRGLPFAAAVLFLLLAVIPRTGAYRTVTALSGSMQPLFAPGDLLVLRPEPIADVHRGQVITYRAPTGYVETHRVVRVLRRGAEPVIETKGDANATRDPWQAQLHGTTVWRLAGVVPGAGRAILWLRRPFTRGLFLYGAPTLLALLGLLRIWGVPGRGRSPSPLRPRPAATDDARVVA